MKRLILPLIVLLALVSCSKPSVPEQYTDIKQEANIFPDYRGVTIPCNIAPMDFFIQTPADEYVTRFKTDKGEWTYSESQVEIDPDEWEQMKQSKTITVDIYTQEKGQWKHPKSFTIEVSQDKIDPYLTYRLISPSYVTYEGLTLNQRNLTNFDEEVIYSNMINTTEKDGQCINCHTSQMGNPNRTQFHVRQHKGGTVINMDGNLKKVNMKVDSTISAGVYPAWHPSLDLIAYSTNHTYQSFHTTDPEKIEVQDDYSDLILYDIKKNEVQPLPHDSMDLDCFPAWSPDGKYLYYCSAHYTPDSASTNRSMDIIQNYQNVHYNLYRRSFDLTNHSFGPRELIYDCGDTCSATLPRISPDGRYLLFARGKYGVFHIWHKTSDLYLMDLTTHQTRCLNEVNSNDVESYHTWSTNGKWIVFSSRRDDGNFTRPYFAHLNPDGTFTKPFELPQRDPLYHMQFLRSYNVPEFLTGPVAIKPQEFAKVIAGDSVQATCNGAVQVHTSASAQVK